MPFSGIASYAGIATSLPPFSRRRGFVTPSLRSFKHTRPRLPAMPEQTTAPLPRCAPPRELLGRKLQDSFNRGSPRHIDQLVDGQSGLLNQIDHGQQSLPLAAEKLRQPPGVGLSFGGESVIASPQGGSPFLEKVSNPTLPRIGSRTAPQPLTRNGPPSGEMPVEDREASCSAHFQPSKMLSVPRMPIVSRSTVSCRKRFR